MHINLTRALVESKAPVRTTVDGTRERLVDLQTAVAAQLVTSHFTITYRDGTSSRKFAHWEVDAQRFSDDGNNFWLYVPVEGDEQRKTWRLEARHPQSHTQPFIDAAKAAAQYDNVQKIWRLYWQMMLIDYTSGMLHSDRAETIELVIRPLIVDGLEKRSTPDQMRELSRERHRQYMQAQVSEAAERGEPYNEREGG